MNTEKMKILFVDDEPNLVMGLKRMLHPLRNEWDMFFVESGNDALELMEQQTIDIIVTDMKMPVMDGAQLLSIVKDNYPNVTRIILSGFSEKEYIMRTSSSAHQFLAKPCKVDTLKSTIQRLINLRKLVINDETKRRITSLSNLPSLPALYQQLDKELNSSTPSIKKISDVISQDITMTAKILQMVNSAFFGFAKKIDDPIQAVNFLGMDTIKSLVLFHNLFSIFENNKTIQPYLEEIWLHSYKVASAAKIIMELRNKEHYFIEQAFAAGLLHDIGKLILIQTTEYQHKITELGKISGKEIREFELSFFGAEHSIVGGYLLGLWGLPDFIVESTAFHHSPFAIDTDGSSILSAIYMSNVFTSNDDIDSDYLDMLALKEDLPAYIEAIKKIEGLVYA